MRITRSTVFFILAALLALAAVAPAAASALRTKERFSTQSAQARLLDVNGNQVGIARFVQKRDGSVHVFAQVEGLTPGLHGIHIHAVGSCGPSFAAAGGHFNPDGLHHGSHAGDLGNLRVPSSGRAVYSRIISSFTLGDSHYTLFDFDGSALVVHAAEDDLVTDPSGNSGARLVCGVVTEN